MGKNKLKKFADMETFACALQYPRERLVSEGFLWRGQWNGGVFAHSRPITVELGCGKGEYTVALARTCPDRNHVGIDIKGARLWSGAKSVEEEGLDNAVFLRTEIENISQFFAPGEVDEIWITFPDPQMQKVRKRLTSTRFLELYSGFLRPGGTVHLKTDSPFLYEYTRRVVEKNGFEVLQQTDDLYGSGMADPVSSIKTYYEDQWLSRGKTIKLLSFKLHGRLPYTEPESDDIERDGYRSMPRHAQLPK